MPRQRQRYNETNNKIVNTASPCQANAIKKMKKATSVIEGKLPVYFTNVIWWRHRSNTRLQEAAQSQQGGNSRMVTMIASK